MFTTGLAPARQWQQPLQLIHVSLHFHMKIYQQSTKEIKIILNLFVDYVKLFQWIDDYKSIALPN